MDSLPRSGRQRPIGIDRESESTGTPATWSDNENIVWRTPLPGPGASSPVLYDGRLYLTCYTGYGDGNAAGTQQDLERHLLCVDPSNGTIIWDTPLASDHEVANYDGFIPLHGYASGTPAVDETGVYVFYGSTGAAAFDFDGSLRWKTTARSAGRRIWEPGRMRSGPPTRR